MVERSARQRPGPGRSARRTLALLLLLSLAACDDFRWSLERSPDIDGPFAVGSSWSWVYDVPGRGEGWSAVVEPADRSALDAHMVDGELQIDATFATPGRRTLRVLNGLGAEVDHVDFFVWDIADAWVWWPGGSEGPVALASGPFHLVARRDVGLVANWISASGVPLSGTVPLELDAEDDALHVGVTCDALGGHAAPGSNEFCVRGDTPTVTGTSSLRLSANGRLVVDGAVVLHGSEAIDEVRVELPFWDAGFGASRVPMVATALVDDTRVVGEDLAWSVDGEALDAAPTILDGEREHTVQACVVLTADDPGGPGVGACGSTTVLGDLAPNAR